MIKPPTVVAWGGVFFILAIALITFFMGWTTAQDYQDEENHLEICAEVAETIEGFRRCAGVDE